MPNAQTGMAVGKYSPNTYDVNLVKRHDDNSAINTESSGRIMLPPQTDPIDATNAPAWLVAGY